MKLKFYKYQGAGNDFILIDARTKSPVEVDSEKFVPKKELVRALCDRNKGIGADGLMLMEQDAQADFRMRYFNADGGESTMCGNGGRCIALFAYHLGVGDGARTLHFNGVDGPHEATLTEVTENGAEVALGMIPVQTMESIAGGFLIQTGSPHGVFFVDEVDAVNVAKQGAALRNNPKFEKIGGVNVNFVEVMDEDRIRVRTYERGVENETQACGTGAVASALVAQYYQNKAVTPMVVQVEGGVLKVFSERKETCCFEQIILQGAARKVFQGVVDLDGLLP